MQQTRPAVLVVENDPELRERLALALTEVGNVVSSDTTRALEAFDRQRFDVVVVAEAAADGVFRGQPIETADVDRHTRDMIRRLERVQAVIEADRIFSERAFVFALRHCDLRPWVAHSETPTMDAGETVRWVGARTSR